MSIVKFKVDFVSERPPRDQRIDALREWCERFNRAGLTPRFGGTGRSLGNLSFRLSPESHAFVITGSTLDSKDALSNDDFVKVVDADAMKMLVVAEGSKDPSSESMMHCEIYKRRKDVGAIFHGHDKDITANAKLLGVPETECEELPGSAGLLAQVVKILKGEKFIVMKNHGFLSLGAIMEEAGELAMKMKSEVNAARTA